MTFYDQLASEYETAVAQSGRVAAAEAFIRRLRALRPIDPLLDIACGTGLFSLAARRQGVGQVTGVDLSEAMLKVAGEHAVQAGGGVDFLHLSMDDLAPLGNARFAAAICMGNSLPHLIEPGHLRRTVGECARVLQTNGILAFHLLNYEKILGTRERLVGVVKSEAVEHIRFYDFIEPLVRFNLLRVDWSERPPATRLESTLLKPFVAADILPVMNTCGFRDCQLYGGLDFRPFVAAESESLLIVASLTGH